jgi:apolipoprotein N-acyltransferase
MIVAKLPRRAAHTPPQPARTPTPARAALGLSLAAGVLLWMCFPPLNLWPLAWLAPALWLAMARMPQPFSRGTYLAVWCGGLLHWLAMMQGIRLAYWALYFGWLALAAYLAVYTVALVWLCRVAVRCKLPLVVAGPIVWTGLELVRAHLITGFSMGMLGHTQIAWISLLQVSDFSGAYGVSFLVAMTASAVAQCLPQSWFSPARGRQPLARSLAQCWPLLSAAACLGAALAYGHFRLGEALPADDRPLKAALIQGSLDTVFDTSWEEHERRVRNTFDHYDRLTAEAIAQPGQRDLIVWPESAFASVEPQIREPLQVPAGAHLSESLLRERLEESRAEFAGSVERAVAAMNAPLEQDAGRDTWFLFGTTTVEYGPPRPHTYNAALLADPSGKVVDRYYKVHPVMFGEYIPFGQWLPWIYDWTPLPGGLTAGVRPAAMEVAGWRLMPLICFENTVPHLVRGHVTKLTGEGTPPDALVTLTNDGWFFGSSILDLHFRCAVFRAVENRRPMLIAANTGFSAHIDGSGRIVAVGPRREPAVLSIKMHRDGRRPLYHVLGDLPAITCAVLCGIGAVAGVALQVRSSRTASVLE